MRMRAPLAAVALSCAAAAAALGSSGSAAAASVAPVAQAWWNVANSGSGAPAPPGTAAKDLFVGGSKGDQSLPNPLGSGGVSAPSPFSDVGAKGAASGIAAVRYVIPAGQVVDRLVLKFDGSPQSSISLAACRTTGSDFKAELNGPWSDVPAYDCSVPSIGSLVPDGTAVQFTDIGGLANGAVLSVVIVPQYAAYSALLPPGPDSLLLRTAPPAYSPASSGSTSRTASGGSGSAGNPGSSGGTSLSAPTGPMSSGYVPPAAVTHPATGAVNPAPGPANVPAPAPAAPVTRIPAARPAVAVPPTDDGRARVASAVGLAAVLGAFAWMIAGDLPKLRNALAARLAGPGVSLPEAPAMRGVGRFRRERSGRPPEI